MSRAELQHLWTQLLHSRGIIRRYFVVNGFDGALTMLGLLTGFHLSATSDLEIVIGACLGATIALGISGLSSAYLSESAERQRWISDLEVAMLRDLSDSAPATAARLMTMIIALVNGLAPVLMALVIITPLWLYRIGLQLPVSPLPLSIVTAFLSIFALGVFLGKTAGTSLLWGGIKSALIASVTVLIILLLEL